jgi:hypothetical protein
MSYHGLGSVNVPTSPPTPSASVYHEPGFKYLFVDENRNPRPEYPAIIASGSIFGMGWTDAQMATGSVRIAEQVPFGKYNLSPTSPPWPGSGVTVYAAPFLGSPDGFFTLVQPKDLTKWANQPGIWIVKLPGNLPFTKASWDTLLGRSAPKPLPPGPSPKAPQVFVCPPGTVDLGGGKCGPLGVPGQGGNTAPVAPQPPPQQGGFEAWIRGWTEEDKYVAGGVLIVLSLVAAAATLSGAGILYSTAKRDKVRAEREEVTLRSPQPMLANSSKRPKRVPVYVKSGRAYRKHEKVHAALQKMGGKLAHQGGRGRLGHTMVYLFPPSKVRSAIATAKRLGGRRTVAKADKRIKVLGGDLVKFPKGFRRNPASLPMFWVGSGRKRERKWVAVLWRGLLGRMLSGLSKNQGRDMLFPT